MKTYSYHSDGGLYYMVEIDNFGEEVFACAIASHLLPALEDQLKPFNGIIQEYFSESVKENKIGYYIIGFENEKDAQRYIDEFLVPHDVMKKICGVTNDQREFYFNKKPILCFAKPNIELSSGQYQICCQTEDGIGWSLKIIANSINVGFDMVTKAIIDYGGKVEIWNASTDCLYPLFPTQQTAQKFIDNFIYYWAVIK